MAKKMNMNTLTSVAKRAMVPFLGVGAFAAVIYYFGHTKLVEPFAKGIRGDTSGKFNWFGITR